MVIFNFSKIFNLSQCLVEQFAKINLKQAHQLTFTCSKFTIETLRTVVKC